MSTYYNLGARDALLKLGMQVAFNDPQQAAQHAKTRGTIGKVTGTAGEIGGGIVGGALGSAAGGLPGSLAGGVAGGMAGEKLLSAPATTAYDAQRDTRNRTMMTRNRSMAQMNAASGLPTGGR